jgi:hypothetical protein
MNNILIDTSKQSRIQAKNNRIFTVTLCKFYLSRVYNEVAHSREIISRISESRIVDVESISIIGIVTSDENPVTSVTDIHDNWIAFADVAFNLIRRQTLSKAIEVHAAERLDGAPNEEITVDVSRVII